MARKVVEIGPTGRRLAANILALRRARNLNQPQLARRMQDQGRAVHATVISKIEQLDRRVDVDDLVALAVALGVTPNRLLLQAGINGDVALTPAETVNADAAWRWACGDQKLSYETIADRPDRFAEQAAFLEENRPYISGEVYFDPGLSGDRAYLVHRVLSTLMAALELGLKPDALRQLTETAIATANGSVEPTRPPSADELRLRAPIVHEPDKPPATAGELMTRPTTEPQPVVAAIVTSRQGVLIGKRNDGTPPWTFIAGWIEPGERPEDAAVREVKEETGVEVRIGEEIGRRVHPATGRPMIYLAAKPTHSTKLIVGDEAELAEVRWASLAEAEELMPDMFEPVREHLARVLAGKGR